METDKDSSERMVVARRRKEVWVKDDRGERQPACLSCAIIELGITGQLCVRPRVTISQMPEDVLVEIFDFYVNNASHDAWHTLVHVCQQWRCVVFASPRRLNLRLYCTEKTPLEKSLNIWPVLPIVIDYTHFPQLRRPGVTNIIAALNQ
jgi:hypothetical protein